MRILALLPLVLLVSAALSAQTPLDSLRAALPRQKGERRYQTLQQLCHLNTRPLTKEKEGLAYAHELMQLAAVRKDTSAWVEGCICAALKWRPRDPEAAIQWLGTAHQLASGQPELLARVCFWQGDVLLSAGKDAAASEALQRGIDICSRHKTTPTYHIRMLSLAARIHSSDNDGQVVDSLSRLAFGLACTAADSTEVFQGFAPALENLGRSDVALDYFLRAYTAWLKLDNLFLASYNIRQAASILRDQKRYAAAIEYYKESISLAERIGFSTGSTYHSLAVLYKQVGDYGQAKQYAYEALAMKQDLGRAKKIITTAVLLAELYHITAQHDSSLLVSQAYLPQSREIKFREATAKLGFLAASSAACTGQRQLALRLLASADSAALSVASLEDQPTLFHLAAQSHAALGRYQDAYRYQLSAQAAQDSIFSQEKNRLIAEIETRFETQIKEDQIRDLDRENALANAQLTAARTRQWSLVASLLLLGLLAFAFYRNAVFRQRSNRILERANADLSRKNQEVQTLLREVHHRVKNNLQIISSLLKLQARKTSDEGTLDALRTGQARVRSMALLHQRLYREDEIKAIPMKAYLADLTQSLLDAYQVDQDRILLRADVDNLTLDIDTAIPLGLIANELITNSLKYAFPGTRSGEILLAMKQKGDDLYLQLSDNGVGMSLLDGQPITSRSSFGLELVASLAQKLNGQLSFVSGPGSTTELVVPQFYTKQLIPQ